MVFIFKLGRRLCLAELLEFVSRGLIQVIPVAAVLFACNNKEQVPRTVVVTGPDALPFWIDHLREI